MLRLRFSWWSIPIFVLSFGALVGVAEAHEAYVLSPAQFQAGWQATQPPLWQSLQTPANFHLFLLLTIIVSAVFLTSFWFWSTRPLAKKLDRTLRQFEPIGSLLVRLSLAASLLFGAASGSFLGPELPLTLFPVPNYVSGLLAALGLLLLVGFWTELAAFVGLLLWLWLLVIRGPYVLSYTNYLAEYVALLLIGGSAWSVDHWLLSKKRSDRRSAFEPILLRLGLGFAFLFAAIQVKFLHPALTIAVATQYNLMRFHYLFPADPVFLTLGAGLAELAIGLCLLLGLEVRLTSLVALFYLCLSLIYFREAVWPHFLLLGLLVSLLFSNGGPGLSNWLSKRLGWQHD